MSKLIKKYFKEKENFLKATYKYQKEIKPKEWEFKQLMYFFLMIGLIIGTTIIINNYVVVDPVIEIEGNIICKDVDFSISKVLIRTSPKFNLNTSDCYYNIKRISMPEKIFRKVIWD